MMAVTNYTVVNGRILSENRGGTKRDYVPDPLGSTVALLDNTQTKTDTWEYWPYGEVRARTGTTATPFQFVGTLGCHRDTASRTQMRARVERTDLGRWLTADPIGFRGGDWNLYRYAAAMPTVLADPMGYGCFTHSCPGADPGLKHYGCYCGDKAPYRDGRVHLHPQPRPVGTWDPIDECCADHDFVYYQWNCRIIPPDDHPACVKADATLCACAARVLALFQCVESPTSALCEYWAVIIAGYFCDVQRRIPKWWDTA